MPALAAPVELEAFARDIRAVGRRERGRIGGRDVAYLKGITAVSRSAEILGRLLLQFVPTPLGWFAGTSSLAFHLSLDSQIMHAIQHGAYIGLPGAEAYTPEKYDTLAIPLQARTWGQAHAIHHRHPCLPGKDPDTLHALYRVHASSPWRFWHRLNTFLGQLALFEQFGWTYNRFLKAEGLRRPDDRSELVKYVAFVAYQYVLFPAMAGARWKQVLAAGLIATVIRNMVFAGLQMGSSVGHEVSTDHESNFGRKNPGEWCRFQVETSKNFKTGAFWKPWLGGLDRHIEHHLFSDLPPPRLHTISGEVRELCKRHGVRYREYSSFLGSLGDSLSYLQRLSSPTSRSPDSS